MKKIILLLTLTLGLYQAQAQAPNCAYTYTQSVNNVTFNHNWLLTLIYTVDSVRMDFGDGNSILHTLPVPSSTNHTYTSGNYNACLTRYLSQIGSTTVIPCTYCDSIFIAGPPAGCNTSLVATGTANSITAIAVGSFGTPPYTYSYTLNPGSITNTTGIFNGLTLGVYSVCATATDALNQTCSVDCDSVTAGISFVCNTTLSLSSTGNTINAVPSTTGGTAPYSYSFTLNPGSITNTTGVFNSLPVGQYTVCVTSMDAFSNLCSTACDSISVGSSSGCTTFISTSISGNNLTATGSAVGSAGPYSYSYTLNPGSITNATGQFNGLPNGSYVICVTATDTFLNQACTPACDSFTINNPIGGCNVTAAFTETNSGLTVNFTNNSTIVNGTITNFAWAFGDGNVSTVGSTVHSYAAPGTYIATLVVTGVDSTNAICIDSTSKAITVSVGVGVENVISQKLNIYPNPTSKDFVIEIPTNEKVENLVMTDVSGRKLAIQYENLSSKKLSISLKNEAFGIYFLKLQTDKNIYTSTVMKQE